MAFSQNPLSLAVPATEVQRWYSEQMVLKFQETSSSQASSLVRSRSFSSRQASSSSPNTGIFRSLSLNIRGGGQMAERLAVLGNPQWSHLFQEPSSWIKDFLGLEDPMHSYHVPETWVDGKTRLRLNLEHFWGNYIRVFAFILFSAFYKQPFAMVGLYILWRISEELERQAIGFSFNRRSWRWAFTRWSLYALMWVVAFFFRVLLAAGVAILVTCFVVGIHGTFRGPLQLQPAPARPVK